MTGSVGARGYDLVDKGSQPIKGRITYSVNEVISQALEKQISNVIKAVRYTIFFASQAVEKTPASLTEFSKQLGNFKNILSMRNLHKAIPNACSSFFNAVAQRSAAAARSALLDCGSCFNTIADTVELTSVFVPLNAAICTLMKNTNVWVTGTCSSLNAITQFKALLKAEKEGTAEQAILSLLRLAMNVSYVAFAAISLGCMAMGVVPSTVTIMTCLASGTAFGLGSFFYEMRNDPYGKNYQEHRKLADRIQFAF